MSRPPSLLLGVDGGGTSTVARLADGKGRVLGSGAAGPSNIKAVGAAAARSALDLAIAGAFAESGLDLGSIDSTCLGLAGFDRPDDRRWLDDWARPKAWAGRPVRVVNDGELVVAAGTPEGWGVGVIAGTGSISVGRGPDGRTARAGGWGQLLGDEGSAYSVALAGLRRVARVADGRQPSGPSGPDPLSRRLCEALGIADTSELVSAVYGEGVDRTRIAALAPAVVAASEDDRSIFAEVLEPAGADLARMVAATARALGLEPGRGVLPLAMAGSFLLNCKAVSRVLIHRLIELGHDVQAAPVAHPVEGALVLARRALEP